MQMNLNECSKIKFYPAIYTNKLEKLKRSAEYKAYRKLFAYPLLKILLENSKIHARHIPRKLKKKMKKTKTYYTPKELKKM